MYACIAYSILREAYYVLYMYTMHIILYMHVLVNKTNKQIFINVVVDPRGLGTMCSTRCTVSLWLSSLNDEMLNTLV